MTPQNVLPASPRTIDSVLARPWGKIVVPSFSDFYFIAILGWLFLAGPAGWTGLLQDADAGWHIRTGEYILDTGRVPVHDLYSWSKEGAPWYAWEWLSDVGLGTLHRWGGLKAVVLAAGAIIALFSTLLMRRIVWHGANIMITLIVSLVGVGASTIHFLARPHILTLLFLAISLWIIEADRVRPTRWIWLLVPITIVWTNLHGGFLALIAALGVMAAGAAIEAWLAKDGWHAPLRYAGVALACAIGSLVNPYGYQLHVHIVAYLRSDWIRNWIQEFQSPSFRSEGIYMFEALLLVGLVVAASLIRRRKIGEALWIIAFAHMALSSVRHVPVFAMIAAPLVAGELTRWWNQATSTVSKKSVLGIIRQMADDCTPSLRRTTFWPAALLVALAFIGRPVNWPTDFPEEILPVKIAKKYAAELSTGRVLSTDQWADYLIYLNYPRQKVFVDGRSDFYGPEIGNQYIQLMHGGWDWESIMERHKFDLALIPLEWPLTSMLKKDPRWRVIEDDGKVIFLARKDRPVPQPGNFTGDRRF